MMIRRKPGMAEEDTLDFLERFRVVRRWHVALSCWPGSGGRTNCNAKLRKLETRGVVKFNGPLVIWKGTKPRTYFHYSVISEIHAQLLRQLPPEWQICYFGVEEVVSPEIRADGFFIITWPGGGIKSYIEVHGPGNRRFAKKVQKYDAHMSSGEEDKQWHYIHGGECRRVLAVVQREDREKVMHCCRQGTGVTNFTVCTLRELQNAAWKVLGIG